MKFIDFNNKAIDCISIEQWRELAKLDNSRSINSKKLKDEEKEVTVVCLSYDTGVRFERFDIAPHMAGKSKEVVHKELINCHYAEILYYGPSNNKYWALNLNIDDNLFPHSLTKFKTREDAINAARLCKNAKTLTEAGAIIAKEFPEFATKIFDYLKWYEETQKFNDDTHNV